MLNALSFKLRKLNIDIPIWLYSIYYTRYIERLPS